MDTVKIIGQDQDKNYFRYHEDVYRAPIGTPVPKEGLPMGARWFCTFAAWELAKEAYNIKERKTMPKKYPFTVQHVGYPIAGRRIQDDEWKTLSQHKTVDAAWERIEKEKAHLEPFQWDDHYRVIDNASGRALDDMDYFEWRDRR